MTHSRGSAVRADVVLPGPRPGPGLSVVPRARDLAMADRVDAIGPDTGLRRLVDVVLAGAGLLVGSPLIAVISGLVGLTSAGPVFFRQERVGRDGRSFLIWKFRTMTADAAARGPAVSGPADPRVTRVGSYLRPVRLDELPQLLNVLRGDMTLIGPRPEVPRFVAHYTDEEWGTLHVRPGLIGPGGLLFATEQSAELDQAEHPDLYYIRHHLHPKLAADLAYLRDRLLVRDLQVVLGTVGALVGRPRLPSGGATPAPPPACVTSPIPRPRRPLE